MVSVKESKNESKRNATDFYDVIKTIVRGRQRCLVWGRDEKDPLRLYGISYSLWAKGILPINMLSPTV